jgi:hypothetical protein
MQGFVLTRGWLVNVLAPLFTLVMVAGLASIEPPRRPSIVAPHLVRPPAAAPAPAVSRLVVAPAVAPEPLEALLDGLAIEPPMPSVFVAPLPVPRPRFVARRALLEEAERWVDAGPRALGVRLDLWCAAALNKFLRNIGLPGTGSDAAASFAHYGRKLAAPAPGAIGVKPRPGGAHVVVVAKLLPGDRLLAVSPNGGRGRADSGRRGAIPAAWCGAWCAPLAWRPGRRCSPPASPAPCSPARGRRRRPVALWKVLRASRRSTWRERFVRI